MHIDYGINLMLSVVSMLYSVIFITSVVRVEIIAYLANMCHSTHINYTTNSSVA